MKLYHRKYYFKNLFLYFLLYVQTVRNLCKMYIFVCEKNIVLKNNGICTKCTFFFMNVSCIEILMYMYKLHICLKCVLTKHWDGT